VHGCYGLTTPPFFITDNDDVRTHAKYLIPKDIQ
jgi:hypothetical protein